MKFKVREGFVCRITSFVKTPDGVDEIVNTFPAGSSVDFDAETAEQHKHKLEAMDKAAARFLLPQGTEVVDISPEQAAKDSAAAAGIAAQ